ncbi:MAG: hypothetical protein D3903_10690 [Candidatus Electrothrix sp. GM3_4]|nr:hypothetical protein [Candidatus Electrothrix sp. GM3_4]
MSIFYNEFFFQPAACKVIERVERFDSEKSFIAWAGMKKSRLSESTAAIINLTTHYFISRICVIKRHDQ